MAQKKEKSNKEQALSKKKFLADLKKLNFSVCVINGQTYENTESVFGKDCSS